jgi:8-oxo-dGTP diphosphatase
VNDTGHGPDPSRAQVVAGILLHDDQILLCHRSVDRDWYPDVWDFPGGHVEPGESPATALVRELREELGIAMARPPEPEDRRLTGSAFDMRMWIVREWSGQVVNAAPDEHDEVAWFPAGAIADLRLADDRYVALITGLL